MLPKSILYTKILKHHINQNIKIQNVPKTQQQQQKKPHNPYLSVLFLPCGVGIFHYYMQLLLVFLFHRTDCSLPYLELGTAPSKWGVFVKQ